MFVHEKNQGMCDQIIPSLWNLYLLIRRLNRLNPLKSIHLTVNCFFSAIPFFACVCSLTLEQFRRLSGAALNGEGRLSKDCFQLFEVPINPQVGEIVVGSNCVLVGDDWDSGGQKFRDLG